MCMCILGFAIGKTFIADICVGDLLFNFGEFHYYGSNRIDHLRDYERTMPTRNYLTVSLRLSLRTSTMLLRKTTLSKKKKKWLTAID